MPLPVLSYLCNTREPSSRSLNHRKTYRSLKQHQCLGERCASLPPRPCEGGCIPGLASWQWVVTPHPFPLRLWPSGVAGRGAHLALRDSALLLPWGSPGSSTSLSAYPRAGKHTLKQARMRVRRGALRYLVLINKAKM